MCFYSVIGSWNLNITTEVTHIKHSDQNQYSMVCKELEDIYWGFATESALPALIF